MLKKGVKFSIEHKKHLSQSRKKFLRILKKDGKLLPAKRYKVAKYKNGSLLKEYISVSEAQRKNKYESVRNALNKRRPCKKNKYEWRYL